MPLQCIWRMTILCTNNTAFVNTNQLFRTKPLLSLKFNVIWSLSSSVCSCRSNFSSLSLGFPAFNVEKPPIFTSLVNFFRWTQYSSFLVHFGFPLKQTWKYKLLSLTKSVILLEKCQLILDQLYPDIRIHSLYVVKLMMAMMWTCYLDTREGDSRWGVRADHQGDERGPQVSKHVRELKKINRDSLRWSKRHMPTNASMNLTHKVRTTLTWSVLRLIPLQVCTYKG